MKSPTAYNIRWWGFLLCAIAEVIASLIVNQRTKQ
jgi:hypothetical protein